MKSSALEEPDFRETGELRAPNDAEQRLMASALALFSKKGYDGTTIREIIEGAGVTRPVLYYYFKNKEHLFQRIVESTFEDSFKRLGGIFESVSGCRERLKAIAISSFELVEEQPDLVALLVRLFFSPDYEGLVLDKEALVQDRLERMSAIMQEGIDRGELSNADPRTLALMFNGLVDIHAMARVRDPNLRLTREFANTLVDLFFDGAGPNGAAQSTSNDEPMSG